MITPDEFRSIALSFPETEERSHMQHPDFRIGGKIFATIGPDETWGMAKLTRDQQQELIERSPKVFRPASGKWGEGGATQILLANADAETAGEALTMAWQNAARKHLTDLGL